MFNLSGFELYSCWVPLWRLEPDDVIIPPFAVIVVTVASQGETLLLTLFSFCGESGATVSDWTHLSGRFRDWEFLFSNCLFNSQLQRVDLGSCCAKEMRPNFAEILRNSRISANKLRTFVSDEIACSKRSDSGERCGVEKAMKSRGGLGREVRERL